MHFLLGALLTGLITAGLIVLVMIVMGEKHLRCRPVGPAMGG